MAKGAYMRNGLQQILGTDKRNPCFTVFQDPEGKELLLFYGCELLEKLPADRNHAQYKLMVARLYNAGINGVRLRETFGVDAKTMRKWGRALESGDADQLAHALAGRQACRKFSIEIQSFIRMRFEQIYQENKRSYSKAILEEVKEVFNVELSSETLRPLLGELKKTFFSSEQTAAVKRETSCDEITLPQVEESPEGFTNAGQQVQNDSAHTPPNRKRSPLLEMPVEACTRFVHHLGILLFSAELQRVASLAGEHGWILKQWLCSLLLGAVNIEQSKLLDFVGLNHLLGRTLKSRRPQRQQLDELSDSNVACDLYQMNACFLGEHFGDDFYYDPHSKQYTGELKILKGWCGSKHFADKVLHMDFIHTASGHPAYVAYEDNYADLRDRFIPVVTKMRCALNIDLKRTLTMVVDRGIYGLEAFESILNAPNLKIITWEKNYQSGQWDESSPTQHFVIQRPRNRANDIKVFTFEYQEEPWTKKPGIRLIRVRATNPQGKTIELGVLSNHDLDRSAEDILRLIFCRWLQENDFKYMEKHFGINQITSYASISYETLQDELTDRQVKSGEYKAIGKQRTELRKKLKQELLNEQFHPGKSPARKLRIDQLTQEDAVLSEQLCGTQREVSRLTTLLDENYRKLDTSSKQVLDALKIIARNVFYQHLAPFKKAYDNYRDDHVIFRNLSQSHGLLIDHGSHIEAILYPTAHHPPARRALIDGLFEQINGQKLIMPDGSGREIRFKLGPKEGIVLAS